MRLRWMAILVWGIGSLASAVELPRSTPEAQGIASASILAFVEAADQLDALHSFMLVRHGHVVAEGWWTPYRADRRHSLYSLSKSFTSTAVGLAAAEGKLSIDDPVLKFFPDDVPPDPSKNLQAMRVSDLLRMSTGHQIEPGRPLTERWTKVFLAQPVPFKPGTHFLYNTSATYMQSAIVQQATGQTLLEYLTPRLFEPLGIESPTWETSPQGVSTGGYGLSIRTEDIAKFGQLYLQRGRWQDRQLVPAAWIDAATARQTSNGSNPASDWDQGYGYQFWRCRHGAYRGDGAFGQFCVVLPKEDAVVAITAGVKDMQGVLDLAWTHLLPAFQPAVLAPNAEAHQRLGERMGRLSLRTPETGTPVARIAGKLYLFGENNLKLEAIALEAPDDAQQTLVYTIAGAEHRVRCGRKRWLDDQTAAWGTLAQQPAAACGGWANDEFIAKICFAETPFVLTLRLKPAGDDLLLNAEMNVGFLPTKQPELVGRAP